MKKLALLLVAAGFAVAAPAQLPSTTATPSAATPAPKPLSSSDKKFIKDFGEAVLVEQKYLAALAAAKPKLSEATQNDVTKATTELERIWNALGTLAAAKGVELPAAIDKSDASKIEKLGKEKPAKFEKEFFKDYSRETGRTRRLVESAKSLQDPEVKTFAEDWSAVIKGHDTAADSASKAASSRK